MELAQQQCPTCGTELSAAKSLEITKKLLVQEQETQRKLAEAKSGIRDQLQREFTANLNAQLQAATKKANEEAELRIGPLKRERDSLAGKLTEAETREAQIRKQAQDQLDQQRRALQAKLDAERIDMTSKLLEAEQREAAAKKAAAKQLEKDREDARTKARAEMSAQLTQLQAERDQATAKAKEAEAREDAVRKEAAEDASKAYQSELTTQRQALETDKKLALIRQQSEFNRERETLQTKLHVVEKQLQKKTANELGDSAEIDVYEALREAFPTDQISRVPKGQQGPDIIHDICYKGTMCARIIVDAKNRQGWQHSYITKLRQDQSDAGADHAILASSVFPAGKKEMCIESDIIVISPARVVHITHLLRNAMITMHVRGLSIQERATKMTRLYALITSESYTRKLSEAGKLAEDILELDVKEKKAHDDVWKKRGILAKRAQNLLRDAEMELAAVIESTDQATYPPSVPPGTASTPPLMPEALGM